MSSLAKRPRGDHLVRINMPTTALRAGRDEIDDTGIPGDQTTTLFSEALNPCTNPDRGRREGYAVQQRWYAYGDQTAEY